MSAVKTTRIKYSGVFAKCAGGELAWPEGKDGKVRVRYFDPRTGEPCDEKPEPIGRAARAKKARELKARRTMQTPDRGKHVIVDGVEHKSIRDAARAVGCSPSTLSYALKVGKGEHSGHEISFAGGGAR